LSYKDELSDTIVRKIVLKYFEKYNHFNYYVLTTKDDDTTFINHLLDNANNRTPTYNMKSLLDTISINCKVSKQKTAQIIFDYELLQSFDEIEENNK